ncbi:MAG: cytochrome bc complex cytochrome b subunit [Chloroherpetonaceae bacterium]|nr:cytochrome bc complex cytochrome b subunit [Chloroherpetonaceae bacterium]
MSEIIAKLKIGVAEVPDWVVGRIGSLKPALDYLGKKTVPQHRASIWYYFGGLTLFFFIVQIITGLLLLLYYKPTESEAFESFVYIQKEVPFGWLFRQVHSWSANLMVLMMFIHMFSAYFMKAYRNPRELMWLTGFVLCLLTLGLGFTGYLLPWNELAFFATKVGVETASYTGPPGQFAASILKGGDEVTGETLTRMFGFHVVLLPGLTLLVLSAHLILMQTLGTSIPIGYQERGLVKGHEPFFPNFLLKDFIGWMLGFALLIFLAVMYPWEIGVKADPLAVTPVNIKPEWYFWAQFQLLKQVPGIVAIALMSIAILAWALIPFIDRKASREEKSPAFTIFGVLTIAFFLVECFIVYYDYYLKGSH